MNKLTQLERDKIRFLKANKVFNPIKLGELLIQVKYSKENFSFLLDYIIANVIQRTIDKCSNEDDNMDLPFPIFSALRFTDMMKTSDLSEEYNGANIDVKVINFNKNGYCEDYLVKYKVIGLDKTCRYFITLKGSFIPLNRVAKVNDKPFNINDIINARSDKLNPKFRKEILKEPLYEFFKRRKGHMNEYELFLKN